MTSARLRQVRAATLWFALGGMTFALAFFVLELQCSRGAFWLVTNVVWYWLLPDCMHTFYIPLGHPIGYAISLVVNSAAVAGCLRLLWVGVKHLSLRLFRRN
ncbi:MAG: hypothetical protein RJA70_204 [Pseudomonadota bacterium]|jgi:hypothetical protein